VQDLYCSFKIFIYTSGFSRFHTPHTPQVSQGFTGIIWRLGSTLKIAESFTISYRTELTELNQGMISSSRRKWKKEEEKKLKKEHQEGEDEKKEDEKKEDEKKEGEKKEDEERRKRSRMIRNKEDEKEDEKKEDEKKEEENKEDEKMSWAGWGGWAGWAGKQINPKGNVLEKKKTRKRYNEIHFSPIHQNFRHVKIMYV
jgi:hypothetical protein